ncbi:MAG: site-specific integrase [Bacteroidales bacterium]|nr:site-specific integrase [Bacteroidales bacterium]MBQ7818948.1 site-specific integrase [Bacteroidales bacterium]
MATIKVRFRTSIVSGKEGLVYYQVIKDRVSRHLRTNYQLFEYEWKERAKEPHTTNEGRRNHLKIIEELIDWDIKRFKCIIERFDSKHIKYTADDIILAFKERAYELSLFSYMQRIIEQFRQIGKYRTSETYISTLKSFMQFREGKDVLFEEIDSSMMQMYEAYLSKKWLTKNSISFYMRILRAVYNRIVREELIYDLKPFKHVYTGIDKTKKRAISLELIKKIKTLDLLPYSSQDFARDMFLFSFYTRGMSFIDMAYLKKINLSNGTLSYYRRKTGKQLFIRWEKCMQEIVSKYNNPLSEYLLPIIKPTNKDERRQYQNAMYLINKKLKILGIKIGCQLPLTMYVARHSWASIARDKNIPISIISEGMGHNSELTTQIYLASLDTKIVDNANLKILKDL